MGGSPISDLNLCVNFGRGAGFFSLVGYPPGLLSMGEERGELYADS